MKTLGFLLLFVTQIASASGGDRVGNGGDVVICSGNNGDAIYILDEYEAKRVLTIGERGQTFIQKVELLLEKFQEKSPIRYALYRKNFDRFKLSVKFIQARLPEINDSYERTGPFCYTRQVAYFNFNTNKEIQYYLQKDLWLALSEDQKAILILHELIYTEAAGLGHFESTYVRAANRILITVQKFFEELFDNQLLVPYEWIPGNPTKLPMQLQNSYSNNIATLFLQKALQLKKADKALTPVLIMLKKRFAQSPRVLDKIEALLLKIEEQQ
jgi:hypothetical protein